jgi:hypothetical protein
MIGIELHNIVAARESRVQITSDQPSIDVIEKDVRLRFRHLNLSDLYFVLSALNFVLLLQGLLHTKARSTKQQVQSTRCKAPNKLNRPTILLSGGPLAGLETCLGNLVGLATPHRPAVPPRGERAVIPIIAIADATDHCRPRVRGTLPAVKHTSVGTGAVATGSGVFRRLSDSATLMLDREHEINSKSSS